MFFKIFGNVPSKSNSYRVSGKRLVKTAECRLFETKFSVFMNNMYKGLNYDGIFELRIAVYFRTYKSDVDGCAKILLDCLEKYDVIKNDQKCIRITITKHVEKKNPRVEMAMILDPKYEPADPLPRTWK